MPIYEYECNNKNCGVKIEQLQKLADEPLKICPECHEETLCRLISAAGFRLKGSGWYETDFKGDNNKKKNLSSKDEVSGSSETKAQEANTKTSTVANDKATKETTTKSDDSKITK